MEAFNVDVDVVLLTERMKVVEADRAAKLRDPNTDILKGAIL